MSASNQPNAKANHPTLDNHIAKLLTPNHFNPFKIRLGAFITGTDTDVGKTVVTAALLRSLSQQGQAVKAIKPIQTGVLTASEGDAPMYLQALHTSGESLVTASTLFSFKLASSPHLAAKAEGLSLSLAEVYAKLKIELETKLGSEAQAKLGAKLGAPLGTQLKNCSEEVVILEGAGGLYVPLNEQEYMLDLMQGLALPIVLVVANKLGVLNHTLLSVRALEQRKLKLLAIVITHPEPAPTLASEQLILADTKDFLGTNLPQVPILCLDFQADLHHTSATKRNEAWENLAKQVAPLSKLILDPAAEGFSNSPTSVFEASSETDPSYPKDSTPDLLAYDAKHIWHPYTSAIKPLPTNLVSHTSGNKIILQDGTALTDGMASWWCAIHGYGHPSLVQSLQAQAERMSHVMFGGLTHEPAIELTKTLLPILPAGLEHIFFADSGSVAVEVALKMALQYQEALTQQGQNGKKTQQRSCFLVPRGGYHGDTMGAMSVCDPINGMHGLFQGFLPQHQFINRPSCLFGSYNSALEKQNLGQGLGQSLGQNPAQNPTELSFNPDSLLPLEQAFAKYGSKAAALILEPIVQGAGGMYFYHPTYLKKARELCDNYGVLFIVDEIATGFGRTGKLFASNWAEVQPDIMCLGKALTGGMLTLAATACTKKVAQGISKQHVFMHGPTFMANPLACAVAKTSVELLLNSPWQARVKTIEQALIQGLSPCASLQGVNQVRVLGAIGVVECTQPVAMEKLQNFFISQQVWLRPFGKLIYCMPPYTLTSSEVKQITTAIYLALQQGVHLS